MSLMEICERCDRRYGQWQVREATIDVGELHRRPHLCEGCTLTVMSALLAVLRPVRSYDGLANGQAVEVGSSRLTDPEG
jgi:hypothetical protein